SLSEDFPIFVLYSKLRVSPLPYAAFENVVLLSIITKKTGYDGGVFASGAALFAAGIHLSYLNVAPQQARTKARNDFVKERLRQKQGK
ncbi:unnamed protein product, partial [Brassica rapa subsp. trilocularis]